MKKRQVADARKGRVAKALCALIVAGAVAAGAWGQAFAADGQEQKPIVLRTMGSFFFGGTVKTLDDGVTFHADHGYAQYYIPQDARNLPIVMWHGISQSGKTFESTPDGREG